MGARDSDLKPRITGFEGTNNLSQETALSPAHLREAINLDLDRDRKGRTRPGYGAVIVPTTLGHSLWTHDHFPFALYADGHELRRMGTDETTALVTDGLAAGMPVSYDLINDRAYWSNGVQRGMVTADGDAMDWCSPSPGGQPLLAATGVGALSPGVVKVAVTFVDAIGRESGATLAAEIELTAPGGVALSAIPQPTDPNVTRIRIYSSCDGDPTLFLHETVTVGTLSAALLGKPEGRALDTQFLEPMPAGQLVCELSGRLIVARGRHILFSQALRYGLYNPAKDWLAVSKHVDVMEPVGTGTDGAGLFVSFGERTHFLGGRDPKDWSPNPVYGAGAVPGSSARMSAKHWGFNSAATVPVWLARNGFPVVGLPGGSVVPINESVYAAAVGERAAALFREAEGLYQYIVAQRDASAPRMAVTDRAVARTYRYNTEDGTYTAEPPEPSP